MPADLLKDIAYCPIVDRCLGGKGHPCRKVVLAQGRGAEDGFILPVPWVGHLATAPILFVSSNPSFDTGEWCPTGRTGPGGERSSEVDPVAFFDGLFDPGDEPWVDDRMRPLLGPGERRGFGTPFWSGARARASEMLGRPAVAGKDFALTEVVHCRSKAEVGVAEALGTCVDMWLRPVMAASAARVVVLFGAHAQGAFADAYGVPARTPYSEPIDVEGGLRMVLQLPHPNARVRRAGCAPLLPDQLEAVRRHLGQA